MGVDEKVIPVHAKPYSVQNMNDTTFIKELRYLVEIGVLRSCGPTEWAALTFVTPKKDGRALWITDFRELNKALKRRVYPLLLVQEVILRRSGYNFSRN